MPSKDIGQLAESRYECCGGQGEGGDDPIELVEFTFDRVTSVYSYWRGS